MSDQSKLFETADISEYYLKYRPTYGPDVFNTIISFRKETSTDFSLAVDVGCGPGQSTLPLTKHFQKVIGVDSSETQISNAPTHIPNLSFRVGPGEDLTFSEDSSVDLVTVAQAMHWMDTEKLYPEVERVLKPGGAFVVYGYGMPTLDEPRAQEKLIHLYSDVLGPYWTDGRHRVEEHYRSYSLPFPESRRIDNLKIERSWTVDELIGYLCSWSAYQKYLMANMLNNTMSGVRRSLQNIYQDGQGPRQERAVTITWPVFMLLGHKPQA